MGYYAIEDIIQIAKVSQYLSEVNIAKENALQGGADDIRNPMLLYVERKSLEYLYAQDSSSTDLYAVGNYVLSLCGQFIAAALDIINPPVEWAWVTDISLPFSVALTNSVPDDSDTITLTLGGAPSLSHYLVVRYSSVRSIKTMWYNTPLNNGTIPDQVFNSIQTSGSLRVLVSRVAGAVFDNTTTTTFS